MSNLCAKLVVAGVLLSAFTWHRSAAAQSVQVNVPRVFTEHNATGYWLRVDAEVGDNKSGNYNVIATGVPGTGPSGSTPPSMVLGTVFDDVGPGFLRYYGASTYTSQRGQWKVHAESSVGTYVYGDSTFTHALDKPVQVPLANVTLTANGATPSLTWSPVFISVPGESGSREVDFYKVGVDDASGTVNLYQSPFLSPGTTSFVIPSGIMNAGSSYFIRLDARHQDAIDCPGQVLSSSGLCLENRSRVTFEYAVTPASIQSPRAFTDNIGPGPLSSSFWGHRLHVDANVPDNGAHNFTATALGVIGSGPSGTTPANVTLDFLVDDAPAGFTQYQGLPAFTFANNQQGRWVIHTSAPTVLDSSQTHSLDKPSMVPLANFYLLGDGAGPTFGWDAVNFTPPGSGSREVDYYVVRIDSTTGVRLYASPALPAGVHSFSVPPDVMAAGVTYKVRLDARHHDAADCPGGVLSPIMTCMENRSRTWITYTTPAGNSPAGSNVSVLPVDQSGKQGVTLTFSQITTSGNTSVVTSTVGPATPAAAANCFPPIYADVVTSAVFTGTVEICLDAAVLGSTCPAGAQLWYYDPSLTPPNNYVALPVGPDNNPATGHICGLTTHFSKFAAMSAPTGVPIPAWCAWLCAAGVGLCAAFVLRSRRVAWR
jgi:hypothetical protein